MMKVLIVDDSAVFRTQISHVLSGHEGIEVVGTAGNGKIALQKLEQLSVDLVTLDMEMPELSGLETLKLIREKKFNVKVIIFSSQTFKGAKLALDALNAGADDVVTKPTGENLTLELAQQMIKESLIPRVLQFRKSDPKPTAPSIPTTLAGNVFTEAKPKKLIASFLPDALVIASSTGGPTALETLFSFLKRPYKIPIFLTQHMPPVFTQILGKRLSELTGNIFREAIHGEIVKEGIIYIAPGDYHMHLKKSGMEVKIELSQLPQRNSVRPAADYMFETASEIYSNKLLGVVLTGMGEDGAVGARAIRNNGGAILIQNKESCVVFGMPGAVFNNNDFDGMGNLEYLASILGAKL
jgi:two-component system chemotaxis response regulator CheB